MRNLFFDKEKPAVWRVCYWLLVGGRKVDGNGLAGSGGNGQGGGGIKEYVAVPIPSLVIKIATGVPHRSSLALEIEGEIYF